MEAPIGWPRRLCSFGERRRSAGCNRVCRSRHPSRQEPRREPQNEGCSQTSPVSARAPPVIPVVNGFTLIPSLGGSLSTGSSHLPPFGFPSPLGASRQVPSLIAYRASRRARRLVAGFVLQARPFLLGFLLRVRVSMQPPPAITLGNARPAGGAYLCLALVGVQSRVPACPA